MIRIYKYSEGENTFIMVDGRNVEVPRFRKSDAVHALCLVHQAAALVIVENSDTADFKMSLYPDAEPYRNSALACAVAYADLLGVRPFHTRDYCVEFQGDTVRRAEIVSHLGECKTVRLDLQEPPLSVLCLGELE